jgi:C-terminal processing protease CtpA/Prc
MTYKTVIQKSEYGIGLDLGKTKDGRIVVQRLKEFPPSVTNPALLANPQIRPGDYVIGINGKVDLGFSETVNAIRTSAGRVELELERIVVS